MTWINIAIWEMAWNKILQASTNITQKEFLVLIKYGCLSSLQLNDRWGVQLTSALGAYSELGVTRVAAKHMLAYLGMQGLSNCLGLPSEGWSCTHCNEEIHLLTAKQLISRGLHKLLRIFFVCGQLTKTEEKGEFRTAFAKVSKVVGLFIKYMMDN